MVTDLPTPEVPMMKSTSPRSTLSSTPRRTGLPPKLFCEPDERNHMPPRWKVKSAKPESKKSSRMTTKLA